MDNATTTAARRVEVDTLDDITAAVKLAYAASLPNGRGAARLPGGTVTLKHGRGAAELRVWYHTDRVLGYRGEVLAYAQWTDLGDHPRLPPRSLDDLAYELRYAALHYRTPARGYWGSSRVTYATALPVPESRAPQRVRLATPAA